MSRIVKLGGRTIRLQVWDTAGQEQFRAVTRTYYRNSNLAFLVFDISLQSSFQALPGWLGQLRANSDPGLQVVLVANKIDLPAQTSEYEVQRFANRNSLRFFFVSAKDGKGVA